MAGRKPSDESRLFALLSYLAGWLSGLILYLLKKDEDDYVAFHAAQSIVLFGALTLAYILLSILAVFFLFIPFIGLLIVKLAYLVLGLGGLVVWVYAMIKAYEGERYRFPIAADLAEKYFLKNTGKKKA